jgi:hypothetical protein
MVLLPFAIKHPEPTAHGKQRHPKLKFQHSSGHSLYWPNKETGTVSVLGRPLMEYEKTPWGVIDPDDPSRAFPMEIELSRTTQEAEHE